MAQAPLALPLTDKQLSDLAIEYENQSARFQAFQYDPNYVIRDVTAEPGKQELWRGLMNNNNRIIMNDKLRLFRMKRALLEVLNRRGGNNKLIPG